MSHYAILCVPDALRSTVNATGAALGRGDNNYASALNPGGSPTIWASGTPLGDDFVAMILAAKNHGILPPGVDWAAAGTSAEAVLAMLADAWIITTANPVPDHWNRLVIDQPGGPLNPEGTPFADASTQAAALLAMMEAGAGT